MGGKHITPNEIQAIQSLAREGLSDAEIGRRVKRAGGSIGKILKQHGKGHQENPRVKELESGIDAILTIADIDSLSLQHKLDVIISMARKVKGKVVSNQT